MAAVGARVVEAARPDVNAVWTPACIGLGSNLDDPRLQLGRAVAALEQLEHCQLIDVSDCYSSDPVGVIDQPRFLNACATLITTLDPHALLAALRRLEHALGKVPPAERFGPRRIDLDLLLYGTETIATETLVVPHPRLHERAFVLYPLADIASAWWVAGRGRVGTLAGTVDATGLRHEAPVARGVG